MPELIKTTKTVKIGNALGNREYISDGYSSRFRTNYGQIYIQMDGGLDFKHNKMVPTFSKHINKTFSRYRLASRLVNNISAQACASMRELETNMSCAAD